MTSRQDDRSPIATAGANAAEKPSTSRTQADDGILTLRDVEGAHVRRALEACHWNKQQAARALGISRDTLYRKISEYGLDPQPGLEGRRPRRSR